MNQVFSDNAKLKSTRAGFSWEKEQKRTYNKNRGSRIRPAVTDRKLFPRFKAE